MFSHFYLVQTKGVSEGELYIFYRIKDETQRSTWSVLEEIFSDTEEVTLPPFLFSVAIWS